MQNKFNQSRRHKIRKMQLAGAGALLVPAENLYADPSLDGAKLATARFYAEDVLPLASAFDASITSANGDAAILALAEDQFQR